MVQDIYTNVGYGGNDLIYDRTDTQLTGNYWNGGSFEVVSILGYMNQIAYDIINNVAVTVTGSHGITQVIDNSITPDPNGCAAIEAAIAALIQVVTDGLTAGNLSGVTRTANKQSLDNF